MQLRVAGALLAFLTTAWTVSAATIGVTPKKLVLIEKDGNPKTIFLASDPGVTKGAGTDVAAISGRLDIALSTTHGAFTLPLGANDGTRGWVANNPRLAEYVGKTAEVSVGRTVKNTVVKEASLLKFVAKSVGDGPVLDLSSAPSGTVSICLSITNGTEQHRFGAAWSVADCRYFQTRGASGRKLVCGKRGRPDPTCSAASSACVDTLSPTPTPPASLSETGLYADIASHTPAAHVQAFAPKYPLWSDAAAKNRWIYLPECAQIDTTDMDDWKFPVGTRAWKEFSLDGKRLETRLVHRYGPGANDFLYATYAWNESETEATLVTNGIEDARGTEHDIPPQSACATCHGAFPGSGGTPARYLGFSAIQLSHAGPGATMASLSAAGALSTPAPAGFAVPGTPIEQAALGYLHANCGNCHNDSPDGLGFLGMNMRVSTSDASVATTGVYTDVVNQPVISFSNPACAHRVAGMNVADSCVHFRMSERGSDSAPNFNQMPPLASDLADPTGLATIAAWIGTLPAP